MASMKPFLPQNSIKFFKIPKLTLMINRRQNFPTPVPTSRLTTSTTTIFGGCFSHRNRFSTSEKIPHLSLEQRPTCTIRTCWYHNTSSTCPAKVFSYNHKHTSLIRPPTEFQQLIIIPEPFTHGNFPRNPITNISKTSKDPLQSFTSYPDSMLDMPATLMNSIRIMSPNIKRKREKLCINAEGNFSTPLNQNNGRGNKV